MGEYSALLVANSRFYADPDHLPELKAPVYDMARLHDALVDPDVGVFGTDRVQLRPDLRFSDMLSSIDDFFHSAEPEDTLLLYYSGHGVRDINNNFFLCASDTRTDRLMSTAVRDEFVNEIMRDSPARTFILILDCCSSGSWKSPTDILPDKLRGVGRFLITSSRAGQNSGDAAVETESSAFTKHLVEALKSADLDTDSDGYIDIDDVYKHVEERLRVQGQQAQRDFGKSTRSVALARRPLHRALVDVEAEAAPPVGPENPPTLAVTPEAIQITDVSAQELPVVERLYVFNRGGGTLTWEADSDDKWIDLEPHDDFVRLSVSAPPGRKTQGSIYVRARGVGGVTRVPVSLVIRHPDLKRIDDAARSYEELRATMTPGPQRTASMEVHWRESRSMLRSLEITHSDVRRLLTSPAEGDRLMGLIAMEAQSQLLDFDLLLAAISRPMSPFEQVHALDLARRMVPELDREQQARLSEVIQYERSSDRIRPGMDRWLASEETLVAIAAARSGTLLEPEAGAREHGAEQAPGGEAQGSEAQESEEAEKREARANREPEAQDHVRAHDVPEATRRVNSVAEYLDEVVARLTSNGYEVKRGVEHEGRIYPLVGRKTMGDRDYYRDLNRREEYFTTIHFFPETRDTASADDLKAFYANCIKYVKAWKTALSDRSWCVYVPLIVGVGLLDATTEKWVSDTVPPGLLLTGVSCVVDLSQGKVVCSKQLNAEAKSALHWVSEIAPPAILVSGKPS